MATFANLLPGVGVINGRTLIIEDIDSALEAFKQDLIPPEAQQEVRVKLSDKSFCESPEGEQKIILLLKQLPDFINEFIFWNVNLTVKAFEELLNTVAKEPPGVPKHTYKYFLLLRAVDVVGGGECGKFLEIIKNHGSDRMTFYFEDCSAEIQKLGFALLAIGQQSKLINFNFKNEGEEISLRNQFKSLNFHSSQWGANIEKLRLEKLNV